MGCSTVKTEFGKKATRFGEKGLWLVHSLLLVVPPTSFDDPRNIQENQPQLNR